MPIYLLSAICLFGQLYSIYTFYKCRKIHFELLAEHGDHYIEFKKRISYNGHGSYLTAVDYYSGDIVRRLRAEQVNQCLELIGQFVASPEHVYYHLLEQHMKSQREIHYKHTGKDCAEIQSNPMMFLAWLVYDNFGQGFTKQMTELFPLYADSWLKKYSKIKAQIAS